MPNRHTRSLVESMIIAAGGHERDLRELVAERGAQACVDTLVEEVLSRCDPPWLPVDVPMLLEITFGEERFAEGVVLSDAVLERAPATRQPYVRITTDLLDLMRSVYGPARFDGDGVRQVLIRTDVAISDRPDHDGGARHGFGIAARQLSRSDRPNPLAVAAQAITAACASRRHDLGDLAIRFGSDKWGVWHWYTRHYDEHFAPLRDEPIKLLEIGIGGYSDPNAGGGSLRMWRNYFPRGIIYGLDIYDKSGCAQPRINTVVGSQADAGFLRDFAEEHGPFDIVIDDGSHINEHVLCSFDALFPHVRSGGWYVIEDTQTSYWPQYGGVGTATASDDTGVGRLKQLLDGLEYQEGNQPAGHVPSYTDRHVVGVHTYHNLAFIEKGVNAEATAPGWVKRAPVGFLYQTPAGQRA